MQKEKGVIAVAMPAWFQLNTFTILTMLVDIFIVTFAIYKLLLLIRGTRAVQLLKGLAILLIASSISDLLNLYTVNWILDKIWSVIFVAFAVIFQPELRRALEQLGRGQFFARSSSILETGDAVSLIEELSKAVIACAKTKTGVLIVLERETGLSDYIETGIKIDAVVTSELLINIFVPSTPLHDGAVIIRGNRVAAAACFLPLTDNPYISMSLGTRHRAAIGLTEVADAVAIIVSEETGIISVARDGKLVRYIDEKQLADILRDIFMVKSQTQPVHLFWQRRGNHEKD